MSTVHRYAWYRARVVEQAYWVPDAAQVELYRVGDTLYARGFLGPARGGQGGGVPGGVVGGHGGARLRFTPAVADGEPVYICVKESWSELQRRCAEGAGTLSVSWHAPGYSSHITQLPSGAVPVRMANVRAVSEIDAAAGYDVGVTDAHKYYAYPLGALLVAGVDAPLTVVGSAAVTVAATVGVPFTALYLLCTQEETPSATE